VTASLLAVAYLAVGFLWALFMVLTHFDWQDDAELGFIMLAWPLVMGFAAGYSLCSWIGAGVCRVSDWIEARREAAP
jgi:hypothetical protein